MCDDRRCPTLREVEDRQSDDFWSNAFVIDTSGVPSSYKFRQCGTNLSTKVPGGLSDQPISALPVEHADNAIDMCRAAVSAKKPVASTDALFDYRGNEILYRMILLPLSDDGIVVNALLGAANFKHVALHDMAEKEVRASA